MDFGADLAGAETLFGAGDHHGAVRLAARCFEAALRETCRRYLAAGATAPRVRDPSARQRLEGEIRPAESLAAGKTASASNVDVNRSQAPQLFTLVAAAGGSGLLAWLNPALGPEELDARLAFWLELARLAEAARDGGETGALEAQLMLSGLRVLLGEAGLLPQSSFSTVVGIPGKRLALSRPLDRNGVEQPDSECALNRDGVWEKRLWLGEGVGLELVWVPPGSFWMGSPEHEEGRDPGEGPRHRVRLRQGFWLSRGPVTTRQYAVASGHIFSLFNAEAAHPEEERSWDECRQLLDRLNDRLPAGRFRLPAEAEWEYACRAGTETPFAFGASLSSEQANFNGKHPYGGAGKGVNRKAAVMVGSFPPNRWGLCDMHGNVWEWCQDVWHDSYEGAPEDGRAWEEGGVPDCRVVRGGSYMNHARDCRSASRRWAHHGNRVLAIGVRPVWTARA